MVGIAGTSSVGPESDVTSLAGDSALHLEILGSNQRRVLALLAPFVRAQDFYLAGGTALALRLGHRESVDFDWFRQQSFDPVQLFRALKENMSPKELSSAPGTLHVRMVDVRVTFLAYDYDLLEEPTLYAEPPIAVASLVDLAAMKLAALLQRGERKDLYDLDALLLEHHSLEEMLRAFQRKYGFDGTVSLLRALTYFDEADATPDPRLLDGRLSWGRTRERLSEAVRRFAAD